MTVREIHICLQKISKRTQQEYHFQAKLHGLEFKNSHAEKVQFRKKEDDVLSSHLDKINKERFNL